MANTTTRILISIKQSLLEVVDKLAEQTGMSRSAFVREALIEHIEQNHIDLKAVASFIETEVTTHLNEDGKVVMEQRKFMSHLTPGEETDNG